MVGGAIKRIAVSPTLKRALSSTMQERLPFVLAQEGLWYDALRSLCERVALAREDSELRAQRAALLEQVGLFEAAKMDRRSLRTTAPETE